MKIEVKKRTSYGDELWEPGTKIRVEKEEAEEYPLKGMIEAGIVEVIKEDSEEDPGKEEEDWQEDYDKLTVEKEHDELVEEENEAEEEEEAVELMSETELTEIDGIGPAYAGDITDEYETVEEFLGTPTEEIAESVHGITTSLAKKVKEKLRK